MIFEILASYDINDDLPTPNSNFEVMHIAQLYLRRTIIIKHLRCVNDIQDGMTTSERKIQIH